MSEWISLKDIGWLAFLVMSIIGLFYFWYIDYKKKIKDIKVIIVFEDEKKNE